MNQQEAAARMALDASAIVFKPGANFPELFHHLAALGWRPPQEGTQQVAVVLDGSGDIVGIYPEDVSQEYLRNELGTDPNGPDIQIQVHPVIQS